MELEITMRNANIPVLVARCERIPKRIGVDRLRKLCAPVREKCLLSLQCYPSGILKGIYYKWNNNMK